jgi:predicted dienelactone hydrolase
MALRFLPQLTSNPHCEYWTTGEPDCFDLDDRGTLSGVRGVALVSLLVAVGASSALAAPAPRATPALPRVLRWVDTSRTIELPSGQREPRPVTTEFWYPPASDGRGPFPLVVFGHGFASTPWWYRRIIRAWAAAGYVVAAPIFPLGNENAPGGPNESDIVNQPGDMSFVITRVLAASASAKSPLSGLVDPARVAVAGQSDGAMTAFAAAEEKPWRDIRVDAAIVLSGAILGPRRYVEHTGVPLLAVQGSADKINPPYYAYRMFFAAGRPKFFLLLRGAGHLPPYTVPGLTLATVEHVTVAFLDHYVGDGRLGAIAKAARALPRAELTSDP